MSKPIDPQEQETLEIIELATQDIETLSKAFDLITEVCKEFDQPDLALAEDLKPVIQ